MVEDRQRSRGGRYGSRPRRGAGGQRPGSHVTMHRERAGARLDEQESLRGTFRRGPARRACPNHPSHSKYRRYTDFTEQESRSSKHPAVRTFRYTAARAPQPQDRCIVPAPPPPSRETGRRWGGSEGESGKEIEGEGELVSGVRVGDVGQPDVAVQGAEQAECSALHGALCAARPRGGGVRGPGMLLPRRAGARRRAGAVRPAPPGGL